MKTALAATMAAAAIALLAGSAPAAEKSACQWTGHDWACGDGNVVTSHYSEAAGPRMPITPIETIDEARAARMSDPSRPR